MSEPQAVDANAPPSPSVGKKRARSPAEPEEDPDVARLKAAASAGPPPLPTEAPRSDATTSSSSGTSAAATASTATSTSSSEDTKNGAAPRKRIRKSGWDTEPRAPSAVVSAPVPVPVPAPTLAAAPSATGLTPAQQLLAQLGAKLPAQNFPPALPLLQANPQLALQQALLNQPALAALRGGAPALPPTPVPVGDRLDRRLYIGSLNYELNELHIRDAFAAFGQIIAIDMPREPNGKSKGFCFVEYASVEHAKLAIAMMNGQMFGGRAIKVNRPTATSGGSSSGGSSQGLAAAALLAQQMAVAGAMGVPGVGLGLGLGVPGLGLGAVGGGNPLALAGVTGGSALQAQHAARVAAIAAQNGGATTAAPPAVGGATGSAYAAELARAQLAAVAAKSGLSVSAPGKQHHRIYVGSIYFELTAEQVKQVFEAFGKVLSCELIMESGTQRHKGYGFVEFEDEKAATDAIAGMNDFELCGRRLKVGRAHSASGGAAGGGGGGGGGFSKSSSSAVASAAPGAVSGGPPLPPALAAVAASLSASAGSSGGGGGGGGDAPQSLGAEEDIKISSVNQRFAIMQKLARGGQESQCIVLRNMVAPGQVDADLAAEVKEECGRYGSVARVVVHEPPNGTAVHIYVLFDVQADAAKARQALDQRFFGGRVVSAEFYPLTKFHASDFA